MDTSNPSVSVCETEVGQEADFRQKEWSNLPAKLVGVHTFRETVLFNSVLFILLCTIVLFPLAPSLFSQSVAFFENGKPTYRGPDAGMFPDTPTRTKIDLAGQWEYTLDGETWEKVAIPSAYDFIGKVTFRRTFTVKPEFLQKSSFRLVMYGVNFHCEVFLNGDFVGSHDGGYSSIVMPVPDNLLNSGSENLLTIVVDNTLNAKDTVPLRQQVWGWRTYGGIFRDIYVLVLPAVWVDDAYVQTEIVQNGAPGKVRVSAYLKSIDVKKADTSSAPISKITVNHYAQVCDKLTGAVVATSQPIPVELESHRASRVEAEILVNTPKLWAPESPNLYTLKNFIARGTQVIDEFDSDFGVRQITIANGDLLLNGKRIVLKGISYHEDHPSFGGALDYETMERDIIAIKNLGANVIRLGHYPPHPYMVNLCDRYGIMAFEEIPVWSVPADILAKEKYAALAEVYLREMIARDKNHPSIIAWGIGDGFDSAEPTTRSYVTRLHQTAKSLDTRPTYYASRMVTNDVCSDIVDIACVNVYSKDVTQFRKLVEWWKTKHSLQPIVITEYGLAVRPENHNGYSDPRSTQSQAKYFLDRYKVLHEENVDGSFAWLFNDWRGDKPILTMETGTPFLYTMGVVSYNREKRLSYEMVKALYNDERIPTLVIGDYPRTQTITYIVWGLVLLLLFAYVFNAFRRFRENVMRSLLRSYNFFADIRDQRVFANVQTTIVGVIIAGTFALLLSSILYSYRYADLLDYVLAHLFISGSFKLQIDILIWHPLKFLVYFTIIFFIVLGLIALLIKLFSFLVQRKVYLADAFSVTIWSALPTVLLIPVGMVLHRIMEVESYTIPLLILITSVILWCVFRLLRGVAIVYDIPPLRVYGVALLLLVLVGGGIMLYLDSTHSTIAYFKFMLNVLNSTKISS
jgi:hypothetical protein